MPRFLLANEFGAGFGHATRLARLAAELCETDPFTSVRIIAPPQSAEWTNTGTFKGIESVQVLSRGGPIQVVPPALPMFLASLYLREEGLLARRIRFWLDVFSEFQPDAVVADYAPSLSLAARGRLPCVVLGNGYTIPPPETASCIHYRKAFGVGPQMDENWMLARVNRVLRGCGCLAIKRLPQLNEGDSYALMTIPCFDPYWEVRTQAYLGVEHPGGSPRPTSTHDQTVIAYFSEGLRESAIIEGLRQCGFPIRIYVGRGREQLKAELAGCAVDFADTPFALKDDLPGRGVAFSQGSLGFVAAAMYAGLPQAVVYQHDEGSSMARNLRLAAIGVAAYARTVTADQVSSLLREAMETASMRSFAHELSHRYAAYRDGNPIQEAAKIVGRMLN